MMRFSPGIAQGCFELLDIVVRNNLLVDQIQATFPKLGGLTTSLVLETAQSLNWIRAGRDGLLCVTAEGDTVRKITQYEIKLRQALLDYIEVFRPPWIQNATFGRARVISFAGNEIAQVFVEADVASGTSDDVVSFWDAVSARARGQKHDRLCAIGRQGERLTLAHETNRTGCAPRWVAIDNNEDGYDVLSVVAVDNMRQLSIEVKASTLGLAGAFHLTRNEWDRCREVEHHAFHLWCISATEHPLLAVISPRDLEGHVPVDSGSGAWQITEIPFASFKETFVPISPAGVPSELPSSNRKGKRK